MAGLIALNSNLTFLSELVQNKHKKLLKSFNQQFKHGFNSTVRILLFLRILIVGYLIERIYLLLVDSNC